MFCGVFALCLCVGSWMLFSKRKMIDGETTSQKSYMGCLSGLMVGKDSDPKESIEVMSLEK